MSKNEKTGIQARRFLRIEDISFPIEYKQKDSKNQKFKKAKAETIGEGGLMLLLPELLSLSTNLSLKIYIPKSFLPSSDELVAINAEATVVWTESQKGSDKDGIRHGVSFTKISLDDFTPLRNFILLTSWMKESYQDEQNTTPPFIS